MKVNSPIFDATNAGGTFYSLRLNGTENERYGLARSMKVMPGDTIIAEVSVKYLDPDTANWTSFLHNLIMSIAGGTAPAGTFVDGGSPGSTGGNNPNWAAYFDKEGPSGNAPKAYLNILIFDQDFDAFDGSYVAVTEAARENGSDGPHEKLQKQIVIREPGYVYIFLSNDNVALGGDPVEVYFDDFKVTHIQSKVVQKDDYYPFGLSFNSYRRENATENRYLYNQGCSSCFAEQKIQTDFQGIGNFGSDFDRRVYFVAFIFTNDITRGSNHLTQVALRKSFPLSEGRDMLAIPAPCDPPISIFD